MRNIFFLLFFSICASESILPQNTLTAIITDPQIGSENGKTFLTEIVNDMNKRKYIDRVIVLGNLTANGSYDEFDLCKEILDGINVEYFTAGGPNDYMLSELNGLEITQLWGGNRYHITESGYDIYIINTVNKFTSNGYVDVETLDWIRNNSERTDSINLIFSYYPITNKVNNGYKFADNFAGKKLLSISPDQSKRKKKKIVRDEIKTQKLSFSKKWNYQLLTVVNDSLFYYNVSGKDTIPKLISVLPFANIEVITEVDSNKIVFYKKNLTTNWQREFGVTNESGILFSEDKIFTADNNGIITSLDKDGKEKWHYETNSTIKSNLLRDKDLVIAAALEGDLFTINANTGDLVQVIGTGETISTNIEMIDIIYNDMKTKGIIFGTVTGNIYCYELYSLEMVWDSYLSDYKISSLTKANNDKIIFRDSKNKIYSNNSSNGLLLWEWQAKVKNINPFFESNIISDGNDVYLADSDGLVNSIDILLGTENWKKKSSSMGSLSFSSDKKILMTQSTKNKITLLSRSNGKVKKGIKLPDEAKDAKINFIKSENDGTYVGFENGILYRIDKKYKLEKLLFMGNSPLISFIKISDDKFIVSNLDGKIIQFSISQ